MSDDPVVSSQDYASPPMTLVLTLLLLVFFFIGFFSVFFCRCFIHTTPFLIGFNRQNHVPSQPNIPEPKGLEPKILNSFPIFTYSTVKDLRIEKYGLECAICIGEFVNNDVIRLLPKCCHVFHKDCIDLWLDQHKTCPICRRDLEMFELQQPMMCGINEDEPLDDAVRIDIPEVHVEENNREETAVARVEIMEVSEKFSRSHSTGHSIGKRDDSGIDKFTLRLPDHLHAKLLRGHNWTGSCTTFGEFRSKTDTGNGGFGEISDFAGGDVKRVDT